MVFVVLQIACVREEGTGFWEGCLYITTCVYKFIQKQLIYTKKKTVLKFTCLFLPPINQLKHKSTFGY